MKCYRKSRYRKVASNWVLISQPNLKRWEEFWEAKINLKKALWGKRVVSLVEQKDKVS